GRCDRATDIPALAGGPRDPLRGALPLPWGDGDVPPGRVPVRDADFDAVVRFFQRARRVVPERGASGVFRRVLWPHDDPRTAPLRRVFAPGAVLHFAGPATSPIFL
ncbi:MAG: hypothetical protein AVDCRST_MAG22-2284, partial [uncultured Rubrobacteraceae bacterium]